MNPMKTTYEARWYPGTLSSSSGRTFLLNGALFYLKYFLRNRTIKKSTLSKDVVKGIYEPRRIETHQRLDQMDFESFVNGDKSTEFILLDDKIVCRSLWESVGFIRNQLISRMPETGTVVEYGCGDGRNILFLKKRFPHLKFIGYELGENSVALAKAAAEKFGMDVEFHQADVCLPMEPIASELAFTFHAIENMPRVFPQAIRNMSGAKRIELLEPVHELWPMDLRGVVSRLRHRHLDYASGILQFAKDFSRKTGRQVIAQRLKAGCPLNETCRIRIS